MKLATDIWPVVRAYGEEKALEFWKQDGGFEMILIREDKTMVVTAPLRAQFEETAGTGYKIEVVE